MMRHILAAASLFLILCVSASAFAQAKPALVDGDYRCKVSKEYKMRECIVMVNSQGISNLTIHDALVDITGNVIPLENKKGEALFVGRLVHERPWGCYSCSEECSKDASCPCQENGADAIKQCMAQPIVFTLKQSGKTWKGMMPFQFVKGAYTNGKMTSNYPEVMMFEVTVELVKAEK